MPPSKLLQGLFVGAVLVASPSITSPVAAREIYPGALAEAADMVCIPQCNLCHTTNPGTASTWQQKKLPIALVPGFATGGGLGTAGGLKSAWAAYAANPANAAAVAAVKAGEDPEYGGSVCGPSYGCGARVAKRSERRNDREVALFGLGAVLTAAGLRLRRRRST